MGGYNKQKTLFRVASKVSGVTDGRPLLMEVHVLQNSAFRIRLHA